jgi:NADH-quinone oxidoreductase subunit K
VAACEASIALALIVILFNQTSSLDVTLWQDIREADAPVTPASDEMQEAEPVTAEPGPESYPHLTTAGIEPAHPGQPWIERRS